MVAMHGGRRSSLSGLMVDLSNLKNKLVHKLEHYPSKFVIMGFANCCRHQPNLCSMDEDDDFINKDVTSLFTCY
jgi:hypothetical protein